LGAAALSAQIGALPEAADGEQTDPSAQESTDLAAADALPLLASFAPTWQSEVQAQLGSVSIESSAAQKPSSSVAVAALNPAAVQAQRDGKESVVAKLAEQAPTHAARWCAPRCSGAEWRCSRRRCQRQSLWLRCTLLHARQRQPRPVPRGPRSR
jgi:hypothetical protein